MIKFLLQPLIENAVFHGLEQKMTGKAVKVKKESAWQIYIYQKLQLFYHIDTKIIQKV